MKLHRIQASTDWQNLPNSDLNFFQKIADKTNGILTPGNIITTVGLGLVINGCQDLEQNPNKALIKISAGRLADYFDGIIADKTQTKSQIGEAADVVADKIATLAILKSTNDHKILSSRFLSFLIIQNSVNSFIGLQAKLSHQELHSSKYGKIATALQTAVFITSIAGFVIEKNHPFDQRKKSNIQKSLNYPTIAMSVVATYDYLNGQV